MTDDAHLDALCAEYLDRLRDSLGDLAPGDRRQIIDQVSEHILSARASLPAQTEAGVRDILERLGTPEEIAASAAADEQVRAQRRYPVLLGAVVVVLIVVGVGLAALLGAFSGGGSVHGAPSGTVAVPSVAGQQVSVAIQRLAATGLSYTLHHVSSNQPPGTVLEQQPAGGFRAGSTSKVTLTVSGAEAVITVPNVTMESQAEAEGDLSAAGLQSRVVVKPGGPSVPGTVVSQSPAAGSAASQHGVVNLTVS